jgi:hypothetical protein
MKKFALLLSVIASVFVLTSCAEKTCSTDESAANSMNAQTAGAAAHHDYKGESSVK